MNENVAKLVPTKPDAELAAEFKQKIIEAANPILDVLEEINKAGFQANISFGMGPLGKMMIGQLIISKNF